MPNLELLFETHFGNLQQSVEKFPERYSQMAAASEYERQRTKKVLRFPLLNGKATGGVLAMGGDNGEQLAGPTPGYVWAVRELNIEGLTTGTTPDVVNIYRNTNSAPGKIFWQLNGNQFCQTFGRAEKILFSGDNLYVASVGTFAATGVITLSGTVNEVAAERIGELF